MRRAGVSDAEALSRFLATYSDTSMFLQGNLAAHGIGGSCHRHATDFLLSGSSDVIEGVAGLTLGGFLMTQMPELAKVDLVALRGFWEGRTVLGMTGVPEQVEAVLAALDLLSAPLQIDVPEPLYTLDLADLRPAAGSLRAPKPEDDSRLRVWFREYALETGQASDPRDAAQEAAKRTEQAIAEPRDVRLLIENGVPVAMTGFNAVLPDMVQVGGVYVPPEGRNRALARTAVAVHLMEAKAAGVARAILFAASRPAARAYEALGFAQVGTYRICLFATPQRIGAP